MQRGNNGDKDVQRKFCIIIFLVEKEEGGQKPVITLKSHNTFVKLNISKWRAYTSSQTTRLEIKMDLKDAYLQVANSPGTPAPPSISMERQGLSVPVPSIQVNIPLWVFSKVIKPVLGIVKYMGV